MLDHKALRCDCGYHVMGDDEAELVENVRLHARAAHGIEFSVEEALLVLLWSQLDDQVVSPRHFRPDRQGLDPATQGGEE
jgi:predicted small metal-binding protein